MVGVRISLSERIGKKSLNFFATKLVQPQKVIIKSGSSGGEVFLKPGSLQKIYPPPPFEAKNKSVAIDRPLGRSRGPSSPLPRRRSRGWRSCPSWGAGSLRTTATSSLQFLAPNTRKVEPIWMTILRKTPSSGPLGRFRDPRMPKVDVHGTNTEKRRHRCGWTKFCTTWNGDPQEKHQQILASTACHVQPLHNGLPEVLLGSHMALSP